MKKIILITTAATVSVIIAAKIGLFSALFMLFLAGVIPGTQIVIPANVMLLIISTIMCVILFYSIAKDIIRMIVARYTQKAKTPRAPRLPKRRFSEI
ncbi:MAG: hypothetical protein ABWX90_00010 [Candidatus Saccharimonadales bacterium]